MLRRFAPQDDSAGIVYFCLVPLAISAIWLFGLFPFRQLTSFQSLLESCPDTKRAIVQSLRRSLRFCEMNAAVGSAVRQEEGALHLVGADNEAKRTIRGTAFEGVALWIVLPLQRSHRDLFAV